MVDKLENDLVLQRDGRKEIEQKQNRQRRNPLPANLPGQSNRKVASAQKAYR
jgi:hypothetical protein